MRAASILLLACALSIAPAARAQDYGGEAPDIVHWSSTVGEVVFPHALHAEDLGLECQSCHHETSAGALAMPHEEYFDDFWIACGTCHGAARTSRPLACSLCHKPMPAHEGDEALSSKVVIHSSCWDCHEVGRGQQASQSCPMCHQKPTRPISRADAAIGGAAIEAEVQP